MTTGPTTIDVKPLGRRTAFRVPQRVRELDIEFPAAVFALHWCYVTLFAALATRSAYAQPVVPAVGYNLPRLDGWQHLVIQPLRNWDGFWYSLIAEKGYGYHPATTAFWPVFPWSMRFVSELFGVTVEAAGWMLANLAFFGALIILHRLARREWGDGVARRAVLLIAFFPTAFYFSAVYSESFFLLFSLLAFYWAKTGRWWEAGIAGLLAALTRNLGVLLVIPLGVIFLKQHGWRLRRLPVHSLALILPAVGPLLYFAYLQFVFGDPLVTLDAQSGWARRQAMPWETFGMAFDQLDLSWLRSLVASPDWTTLTSYGVRFTFSEYESLDIIVTTLAIPLLVYCLRRLPLEYAVYSLILFALPLFSPSTIHPLMSFPRFVLVIFPLFIGLAMLTRRRWTLALALAPSVTLLALLTIQFSTWFWVA